MEKIKLKYNVLDYKFKTLEIVEIEVSAINDTDLRMSEIRESLKPFMKIKDFAYFQPISVTATEFIYKNQQ